MKGAIAGRGCNFPPFWPGPGMSESRPFMGVCVGDTLPYCDMALRVVGRCAAVYSLQSFLSSTFLSKDRFNLRTINCSRYNRVEL